MFQKKKIKRKIKKSSKEKIKSKGWEKIKRGGENRRGWRDVEQSGRCGMVRSQKSSTIYTLRNSGIFHPSERKLPLKCWEVKYPGERKWWNQVLGSTKGKFRPRWTQVNPIPSQVNAFPEFVVILHVFVSVLLKDSSPKINRNFHWMKQGKGFLLQRIVREPGDCMD